MATATALLVGTGCSSGSGTSPPNTPKNATATPASPPRPVHDPPSEFALDSGSPMPEEATAGRLTVGGTLKDSLPIALHKSTAYVALPDRVQAVDTADGRVLATIAPREKTVRTSNEWDVDDSAEAPAVIPHGETATLVAPFLVERSGTGTQADHTAVELTGSDMDSHEVTWRLVLDLPKWAETSLSTLYTEVAGAENGKAVVTVQDRTNAVTFAVDVGMRKVLWTQDRFRAVGIAAGTAVGTTVEDGTAHERVAGRGIVDGKQRWIGTDSYALSAYTAGPHLIVVHGRDYATGDAYHRLVDARSGVTRREMPTALAGARCTYDDRKTLVCSGKGAEGHVAAGMDARSGGILWQLPDDAADRVAPKVSTAWHGRVYGTTGNGIVALDARTGKDLSTPPDIAPVLVNESVGLALDESGDVLMAYPTSG
ncbi:hypothetical protein J7E88_02720 [Streptomyces sp. ISL-10]|uniref:PQQ-like beta-propeller repeat protein n=1 Tax=Streptomyces sp. ISL-10 TaxID=2819172 RepID=UPI001BE9EEEC|nr:PQQ-like beta-propeller repeat protein [Streptomyces sp. ISL-10]MBT2364271.1 hypothetical protein [Streptomyces sp. ISL-10]